MYWTTRYPLRECHRSTEDNVFPDFLWGLFVNFEAGCCEGTKGHRDSQIPKWQV